MIIIHSLQHFSQFDISHYIIMAPIEELPSDIVFEILVLSGNLRQLWFAVSSCNHFYQTFDQRRSLILQRVFREQLSAASDAKLDPISPYPKLQLRANHVRRKIAAARTVVDRCHTTPQDALCLHAAAWDTFLGFEHHLWLDCSWGQQLIDRYTASGRRDLARQCAGTLWKRLINVHIVGKPKQHLDNARLCNQGAAHGDLAQKLAIMYLDAGQYEDAIDVLRTCYEIDPKFNGYGLLSTVMRYYRASDCLTELQLVPFFQERILKQRTEVIAGTHGRRTRTAWSRFHFTHCLVMVLTRANQHAAATDAINAAVDLALQDTMNKVVPVGLSRKLIRMLQEQQRYDEALIVRKRILDALAPASTETTQVTSQLIAWAKEYTSDLRLVGREEQAISVETDIWTRLRTRAAVHIDCGLLYHARNAAWTLAKSYEEHDEIQKAVAVRLEYEGLVNTRLHGINGDMQLFWPGSKSDAGITKFHSQVDIPIMVSTRELVQ